ncbi:MAG: prepilin-type N-terminal cleavage/methylation domain-containing protein [Lachnospiraceae bacterium]|nr:prepilin-type N-terminal cleavage/methylation domain-containing protein [Lachnospiraceae bacterium]
MKIKKMNNKGVTLLETIVCFVLLSILLVAAAQVITSSSQIYYFTKATSYGIQASQIISTEIRGELEKAVAKKLSGNVSANSDSGLPSGSENYCVYFEDGGNSITFINNSGEQIVYRVIQDDASGDLKLVREAYSAYSDDLMNISSSAGELKERKEYNEQYVGMGYRVKNIKFNKFIKTVPNGSTETDKLPTGDFPVIVVEITVNSPQYGDYVCTEYIALYNFYGMKDSLIPS